MPERQLVTLNEAADLLRVTPRSVRRYVSGGLLTGYRVGPKLFRVDLAEVEQLARPIPTVRAS